MTGNKGEAARRRRKKARASTPGKKKEERNERNKGGRGRRGKNATMGNLEAASCLCMQAVYEAAAGGLRAHFFFFVSLSFSLFSLLLFLNLAQRRKNMGTEGAREKEKYASLGIVL